MFEQYRENIKDLLIPLNEFKPFPQYEDRAGWEAMSDEFRAHMIQKGEEYLGYGWPTTLASVYMDFYRNGNRSRYEDIVFNQRRRPLMYLVLAECCEGKGRFIDDIINGVWVTLDEATWIIPASNPTRFGEFGDTNHALPYTQEPEKFFLELFTGECAGQMAMIYYLIGKRLGEETPQIPHRMLGEIERRALRPFLTHDHFWWMGLQGQFINNWNPWIISNVMTMAGFACPDEEERAEIFAKCLLCLEQFVKIYAPDGGCDEGPNYWGAAGAALFNALEILYDVTGGKASYRGNELINNMCTYIYKVHISGDYYVDNADCPAKVFPSATTIFRMGKFTGDEKLMQHGVTTYARHKAGGMVWDVGTSNMYIYGRISGFFAVNEIEAQADASFPLTRDTWFPGIQVLASRMEEGSDKGLYLSAKGGHNNESHNHNDIGSFVIYCDGKPVFIDIGTGVYEKRTFDEHRYEILQMQSLYHNLPVIGGDGQKNGRQYEAQDVTYTCSDEKVTMAEDLRDAYPAEVGIESWKRDFTFNRANGTVTVADDFALTEEKEVQLVLMTAKKPVFADGEMTVAVDEETAVTAKFDPALAYTTELFQTGHDASLTNSWGAEGVYRTVFTLPGKVKSGCHTFTFRKK